MDVCYLCLLFTTTNAYLKERHRHTSLSPIWKSSYLLFFKMSSTMLKCFGILHKNFNRFLTFASMSCQKRLYMKYSPLRPNIFKTMPKLPSFILLSQIKQTFQRDWLLPTQSPWNRPTFGQMTLSIPHRALFIECCVS